MNENIYLNFLFNNYFIKSIIPIYKMKIDIN